MSQQVAVSKLRSSDARDRVQVSGSFANAAVREFAKPTSDAKSARVSRVLIGSRPVDEQFLIVERLSWAANNVQAILTQVPVFPDAELAAARDALVRLENRSDENVEEWATTLGKLFSGYSD